MVIPSIKSAVFSMVLFVLQDCQTQRRIKNGNPQEQNKPYMAYFIRAAASRQQYDAWLCGGTIVTSRSIITAAACIEDVKYMYVIAGYMKYVPWDKVNLNACTKEAKKKVVITCVPKRYDFAYEKIERWSFIDIAIAKVESPFDFTKKLEMCSYAPGKLKVNFEEKWQVPGLDAFVLGWGHAEKWRQKDDTQDYNLKKLHYTTTVIINKAECKKQYSTVPQIYDIIDRYMICADGAGNINPEGDIIEEVPRVAEGCDPSRRDGNPESCEVDEYGRLVKKSPYNNFGRSGPNRPTYGQPNPYGQPYGQPYPGSYGQPPARYEPPSPETYKPPVPVPYDKPYPPVLGSPYNSRRVAGSTGSEQKHGDLNSTNLNVTSFLRLRRNYNATRRNGICQNDHGGPLVTWVGAKEFLIGVASVFRIDENNACIGPYLYTSTQCNAAFLHCVLSEDKDWGEKDAPPTTAGPTKATAAPTTKPKLYFRGFSRKEFCDLPPRERGFDMMRRQISWADHPDGPAANELTEEDLANIETRPQIPMSVLRDNQDPLCVSNALKLLLELIYLIITTYYLNMYLSKKI